MLIEQKTTEGEFDEDSRFNKVMSVLNKIIGCLILGIFILLLYCMINSDRVLKVFTINYECNSKEEQIENSNTFTLDYYLQYIDTKYSSVLISPLAIQSSVYDICNTRDIQNASLFTSFNNGYKSWAISGELFDYDCLSTIYEGELDSLEAFGGRLSDLSDNTITTLNNLITYDSAKNYSIFSVSDGVKNGKYHSLTNFIYYNQALGYKETDDYTAVRLDSSSDNYYIYLIEGDLNSFSFDGFYERTDTCVMISAYTWQSSGSVTGLVNALGVDDCDLNMVSQFGFSKENHEVVDTFKEKADNYITFISEYSIIITDKENSLILAIGKC